MSTQEYGKIIKAKRKLGGPLGYEEMLYQDIDGTSYVITLSELALGITPVDTSRWDEAFSWGNHALAGYLTSYTETDPIFLASQAANITAQNITDLGNLSGLNSGDQYADGDTILGTGSLLNPFTVDSSVIDHDSLNNISGTFSQYNHLNNSQLTLVSDLFNQVVSTYTSLPAIGNTSLIYLTLDTNKFYTFNGSIYIDTSLTLPPGSLTNDITLGIGWNANTNDPTIVSGVGNSGDFAVVSVNGTTTIDGIDSWYIGDYIWFDDTSSIWRKIDNQNTIGVNNSVEFVVTNETEFEIAYTDITTNYQGGKIIFGASFALTKNHSFSHENITIDGENHQLNMNGFDIIVTSITCSYYNIEFIDNTTSASTFFFSISTGTNANYLFYNCKFHKFLEGASRNIFDTTLSTGANIHLFLYYCHFTGISIINSNVAYINTSNSIQYLDVTVLNFRGLDLTSHTKNIGFSGASKPSLGLRFIYDGSCVNSNSLTPDQIYNILSHNLLRDMSLATTGVTYGHISDTTQTIDGEKTLIEKLTLSYDPSIVETSTGNLHILGENDATRMRMISFSSIADWHSPTWVGGRSRGTSASRLYPLAGDHLFQFLAQGWSESENDWKNGANFTLRAEENWGAGYYPGLIALQTGDSGGTLTDRLTIDSDGDVTITQNITALNLTGTNTGNQVADGVTITGYGTVLDPFVAVDNHLSVGVCDLNVPGYTNNLDGTVTIDATIVALRSTPDHSTPIVKYNVSSAIVSLVDGGVNNYISAIYNGGTSVYTSSLTAPNGSDATLIYILWRIGTTVHSVNQDSISLGLPNKINSRLLNTEPYKIASTGGLILSETTSPANRTLLCTSAIVYKGVVPEPVLAYNSSIDILTEVIWTGSAFTYTLVTVYDNLNYNPYTGGTTILGNNKYGYRIYFRSIGDDKEIFYMLSPNLYNSADLAREASISGRTDIPELLKNHCVLVGRSIIEYNVASGVTEPFLNTTGFYLNPIITDYVPLSTIEASKKLTGFIDNSSISITYSHTNRTVTLTGDLRYLWRGNIKTLSSPWTSSAHSATIDTTYFLYSTDGDNFSWSSTSWSFTDAMISLVRYRSTSAQTFALREIHGLMDEETHKELHSQLGTYRVSGLGITPGTYTLNTATDIATTPGFESGVIKDEDLETTILALTQGSYTLFNVGSGTSSVFTLGNAFPFLSAGSYMQVNDITTGTMTDGINNRFYNICQLNIPVVSSTDSQAFRMVFIQPQNTYTTLAAAEQEDVRGLSLGDLGNTIPEYVTFTRLTYQTASGDTNTGKCRLMSITYVLGNRAGQVAVSGFTPTAHDALTPASLVLTASGHTGTAYKRPSFGSLGEVIELDETSIIEVACSDLTTDNAVATTVASFPAPYNCTVLSVVSSLDTVCTGSTHITDVNYDGATMLSTKCSVDASEYSSLTAATPAVISVATWVEGKKVTIDRDQVGATIAGKGHVVYFVVRRT